ncbi:hypothetical protein SSS_06762 [Sarcoptes scabiei]|uniref:Uncharacterized protein n=1 Tax=Sarcoptes scabiei TaxID=52283 RepID=A0A834R8F0_SARSC|nr:hypothetical protein SSS_06762 [Sarcoptes scabiei]
MFDLKDVSLIEVKNLSEEETDAWCREILEYSINENDIKKSDLISLFQFCRALLKLKHLQTDVLVEELQTLEQRFEDAGKAEKDLENKKIIEKLTKQSSDLTNRLNSVINERDELKSIVETNRDSTIESEIDNDFPKDKDFTDKVKDSLQEKNVHIEKLLDKLYDSERINLDLAQELVKYRENYREMQNQCDSARIQCKNQEKQIEELEIIKETLMVDNKMKSEELLNLKKELLESQHSIEKYSNENSNNSRLLMEVEETRILLQTKDKEISQLNQIIQSFENNLNESNRIENELSRIENFMEIDEKHSVSQSKIDKIENTKIFKKISKQKNKIESQSNRIKELEIEINSKDEELALQRKRWSMLIDGEDGMKKLLEENSVLNRMIRFRDKKIDSLISQLNKHNLKPEDNCLLKENPNQSAIKPDTINQNGNMECIQKEIESQDELIALSVERDILKRQNDAFKIHLESVCNENLELQIGMKEILDQLRISVATSDLVLECPSLERVCCLLENRSISNLNSESGSDITQRILLKSELDYVRGQNEHLRIELKNLQSDFLSVIEEFTEDMLNNWTISQNDFTIVDNTQSSSSYDEFLEKVSDDSANIENKPISRLRKRKGIGKRFPVSMRKRPKFRARTSMKVHKSKIENENCDEKNHFEKSYNGINSFTQTECPTLELSILETSKKDFASQTEPSQLIELDQTKDSQPEKVSQPILSVSKISQNNSLENVNHQEVQTVIDSISKAIQTNDICIKPSDCERCQRYYANLKTIKNLIAKERKHFNLNERKHCEQIDSLRQNIKFLKKEYQIDIDAKNTELKDLRQKIWKLSIEKADSKENMLREHRITSTKVKDENKMIENNFLQVNELKTNDKWESINQSEQGKIILETTIKCLQNCLQQKSEALEEYRSIVEHMKENFEEKYIKAETNLKDKTNNNEKSPIVQGKIEFQNGQVNRLENVCEKYFLKSETQQSDQLINLVRSTLAQLESVRSNGRDRIKQLETELRSKSESISQLESKNKNLIKELQAEKSHNKEIKRLSESQEIQIRDLNKKLDDLVRKNQQSIQAATVLKKKVDNSVFQESANLRVKITELNDEIRKLEMEKWNLEKRLTQEKQILKDRLNESAEKISSLLQQSIKFQEIIKKFDKKLKSNQQKPIIKCTKSSSTQTFEVSRSETHKLINSNNQNLMLERNNTIEKPSHRLENSYQPLIDGKVLELVQSDKNKQSINEYENFSKEIVIDPDYRQGALTSMNEILILGDESIESHKYSDKIRNSESSSSEEINSSDVECNECKIKFDLHRIEQDLIGMRLEHLFE